MNFTSDIFAEALVSKILPIKGEVTLCAMQAFGGFALDALLYYAIIGATIAGLIWYGMGAMLRWLLHKQNKTAWGDSVVHTNGKTRCAINFLALLAGVPTLGFLVLPLLGVWRANLWMVLPLSAFSYAVAYQMVFLN